MKKLPIYNIKDFKLNDETFYANDLKSHIQYHGFINRPHKHDFYLTVLFTKGKGTHEIDFTKHKVIPGSVFFMTPGQVHCWQLSNDVDGYIFFHTAEFYNLVYAAKQIEDYSFFSSTESSPVIYLDKKQHPVIKKKFENIFSEFKSNSNPLKFQKLINLCDLLYIDFVPLHQLVQKIKKKKAPLYLQKLAEFKKLVDKNYLELKLASDYAELMSVSAKHLNRISKETINKTATEIITERILLEAKRLLVHSGKSVKEIAIHLGFTDPAYFTRMFKRKTALSPANFQTKNR